jgi:hypothetical protein
MKNMNSKKGTGAILPKVCVSGQQAHSILGISNARSFNRLLNKHNVKPVAFIDNESTNLYLQSDIEFIASKKKMADRNRFFSGIETLVRKMNFNKEDHDIMEIVFGLEDIEIRLGYFKRTWMSGIDNNK